MKSKSVILILTAASLLTGCGNGNSGMNESSVGELERSVTVDSTCSRLFTTETVTARSASTTTTTTTTQTTTTLVTTATSNVGTKPEIGKPETKSTLKAVSITKPETISSSAARTIEGNVCPVTGMKLRYTSAYRICKQPLTIQNGVVWYGGHKETYYSEKVLPGPRLAIPDRHHGEDGTIRDADGYICVAANYNFLPHGSIVVTSLGPGKVYDTGCVWGTIDIYTCW